jgi:hypothetical protein
MKADDNNGIQKETSMYAEPIMRRIAVLHKILQNSFVPQQYAVSSRQHIKSYSSMFSSSVRRLYMLTQYFISHVLVVTLKSFIVLYIAFFIT